ncbi:MAG: hypothetical protein AAGF13_02520 [Pseudomonadota bacterium]
MNKAIKITALFAGFGFLTACADGSGAGDGIISIGGFGAFADARTTDKTLDRGRDAKDLSQLVAGIWVDPNGCEHWIIDDGVEGYLSQRVDPYGKPVCGGHGAETIASGPFKAGTRVPDLAN